MWVACKKQKIEPTCKRKNVCYSFNDSIKFKKARLRFVTKRKIYDQKSKDNKRHKKHHCRCLLHKEDYICNIYDCSGVQDYNQTIHMPYIN